MADFCHFFPSNRGKWRDQAFIEGQTPPSPLLYHHLSQKKKKKTNDILHAIYVTDMGATQNPEFPWTKPKAICDRGTFLSVFGLGQIGNLISGRGVFYQGIRYFFSRILGIPKFTPWWKICLSFPNWTSRMEKKNKQTNKQKRKVCSISFTDSDLVFSRLIDWLIDFVFLIINYCSNIIKLKSALFWG